QRSSKIKLRIADRSARRRHSPSARLKLAKVAGGQASGAAPSLTVGTIETCGGGRVANPPARHQRSP
ncbi:MAG: hypothetical protein ABSB65_17295, partial [Candidatus Acidiferrales bacterium]